LIIPPRVCPRLGENPEIKTEERRDVLALPMPRTRAQADPRLRSRTSFNASCSNSRTGRLLRQRGIPHRIVRSNTEHGAGLGRWRRVVERTFARLHAFRRLATRYERRGDIHTG
jgi:transposase